MNVHGNAKLGPADEYAHSIVDDHSRLAYTELHPDQRAATVTGFVTRALAWYQTLGIQPRRIMTDNACTRATSHCADCSKTTRSGTC